MRTSKQQSKKLKTINLNVLSLFETRNLENKKRKQRKLRIFCLIKIININLKRNNWRMSSIQNSYYKMNITLYRIDTTNWKKKKYKLLKWWEINIKLCASRMKGSKSNTRSIFMNLGQLRLNWEKEMGRIRNLVLILLSLKEIKIRQLTTSKQILKKNLKMTSLINQWLQYTSIKNSSLKQKERLNMKI